MYLYDWVFFFVEVQKIEKYFVQVFVSFPNVPAHQSGWPLFPTVLATPAADTSDFCSLEGNKHCRKVAGTTTRQQEKLALE